ncbi:MAG: DUF1565 domain-containing protein [Kiritimatiellaeota bacterium]|nr:DUF1565 domain-containing protein [Kiritimatiellota bacterium]
MNGKSRSSVFPSVVVVVCALLFPGAISAREVYVSISTGSNRNPGTKKAPIKLLWKAIKNLKNGDNIHVAEGTYRGRRKTGLMPGLRGVTNVSIEGGWNKDFSKRLPFEHLTIIGSKPDLQPPTGTVFHFEDAKNLTIDGFLLDRGIANFYYGDGEPGANKSLPGYIKDSAFGYRAINRKKVGSSPTVVLMGKGAITIRNMVLINNPWWGIYIKGGGNDKILIENNLILISQGRGIEAITGGGWGTPTWIIRNNTVVFNHTVKSTEGRALSIDPRKGYGRYIVENNVFAYSDGSGVSAKFGSTDKTLTLNNNIFFFNRRGDYGKGGSGVANVEDFEDELEFPNEGNAHVLPGFLAKSGKKWFDRYSSREYVNMLAGTFNTWKDLNDSRKALSLGKYHIPGYDKAYATYADLPQKRNNYDMSRYPFPLKQGETIDWKKYILPIIGADGEKGIQPVK